MMDHKTIYLDENHPFRLGFFYVIQSLLCILWLVEGIKGILASEAFPWIAWIKLSFGLFILFGIIWVRKLRRLHVSFNDVGLVTRTEHRKEERSLSWNEISDIRFSRYSVDILPKDQDVVPISIPLDSYAAIQDMKANFVTLAKEKQVEISEY